MIKFNKEESIFHLYNNDISYVMFLSLDGMLETLHFGKRIKDTSSIIHSRNTFSWYMNYSKADNIMVKNKSYTNTPYQAVELSPHAAEDKRSSPIIIQKENGSYLTKFKYLSHKIRKGIKAIINQPCLDNPADNEEVRYNNKEHVSTLEITYKEENYDIYLIQYISIYEDKNIIVKNFEIINKEKHNINLLKAASMQLDLNYSDYTLHQFYGKWGYERLEEEVKLIHGKIEISSNFGRSSHEFNPFFFLERNDDIREIIGFNLIYSGNFKAHINRTFQETLHIVHGIDDEDFNFLMKTNDYFITPQVVISYSSKDIDDMSHQFHHLIEDNLISYQNFRAKRPLIFNNWEGCMFDFNTESIIKYIDEAERLNIDLFVLDDGWFGKRNNDLSSLGDWYVNEEKISLHKIIDHLHQKNIKFGLWFEPEMISPDSSLFRKKNLYALGISENVNDISLSRQQLHLDLTNDEVIDNIFKQMCLILDEYDIDYVKWDYNRYVHEHFSSFLNHDQQGEVYTRLVYGYYKLLFKLVRRYPKIMFEGCASGGGRFDLGTLYFTPQIWTSDETDARVRIFIQYSTSYAYPLSTISSHVSASPFAPYKTRVDVALFGTYGYEMNPNNLNEKDYEILEYGSSIYKKYHHEIIQNGTVYHLISPYKSNYMAMESVAKDLSKAMVLFYTKEKVHDKQIFLKLKGLDENKYYFNHEDMNIYRGDYLMNVGLNLSRWLNEGETILIILEEKV